MNPKAIGMRLRCKREKKGMSMAEVSEALGISKSALSMYENGERIPRDEIKLKLASYYKTSVQALFFAD